MFASVFSWLLTQTKNAILSGVDEALAEIEGTGTADTAPVLAQLRTRLQPTLTRPAATVANSVRGVTRAAGKVRWADASRRNC
jgi:hypothetical protein